MVEKGEVYRMTGHIETVYSGSPLEELETFEVFEKPARVSLEKCDECIEVIHTDEYCRDVIMIVEASEFRENSELVE